KCINARRSHPPHTEGRGVMERAENRFYRTKEPIDHTNPASYATWLRDMADRIETGQDVKPCPKALRRIANRLVPDDDMIERAAKAMARRDLGTLEKYLDEYWVSSITEMERSKYRIDAKLFLQAALMGEG